MKTPKISVIVPVYNAEKYLHQCVDSILAQTFTDFEVLLIDDGSKDKSGAICDECAAKDDRVHVFHNTNMGSAAARQFGFEHAKAKYIAAVDADDWLDANYLEDMVNLIEKEDADMVMCAYWMNEDRYMANEPTQHNAPSWRLDMLLGNCHAGLWNKLLKKELLLSKDALVPPYNYYEDMVVTLSYLQRCSKVVYCPVATYHYRQNAASLTNDQNISKRLKMYEECMRNLMVVSEKYGYMADAELVKAIYERANSEKVRLLPFITQYHRVRPYLVNYFPNSPSIMPVTNLRSWGSKNVIKGHLLPYLIFKTINWTKNHIKKSLVSIKIC